MAGDNIIHIIKNGIAYEAEEDEDGSYVLAVPALPGCMTVADTLDEALVQIDEAIASWIATAVEHGKPVPKQFALREAS